MVSSKQIIIRKQPPALLNESHEQCVKFPKGRWNYEKSMENLVFLHSTYRQCNENNYSRYCLWLPPMLQMRRMNPLTGLMLSQRVFNSNIALLRTCSIRM